MKLPRTPVFLLLILAMLTACAAPTATETPAPTLPAEGLVDLSILPTTTPQSTPTRVVAKTPKPFHTTTLVPTVTPMPSLTPLPTIDPTLVVPTGIKIEKQKDGTLLVNDYDEKIRFTIPAGWAAATVDGKDPSSLLETLSKDIPNSRQTIGFINMLAPKYIQAIGVNTSAAYANKDYPFLLRVAVFTDAGKTMTQLDLTMSSLRNQLVKEEYKVTKSSIKTYANGIKAGVIDATESFSIRRNRTRATVEVFAHIVVFQVAGRLVVFSAAAPNQFSGAATSVAEQMVSSIEFIK